MKNSSQKRTLATGTEKTQEEYQKIFTYDSCSAIFPATTHPKVHVIAFLNMHTSIVYSYSIHACLFAEHNLTCWISAIMNFVGVRSPFVNSSGVYSSFGQFSFIVLVEEFAMLN